MLELVDILAYIYSGEQNTNSVRVKDCEKI